MSSTPATSVFATYVNPVHGRSFPDPFVIKVGGEYYAYATGFADDGNVFAVLRSNDLVTWSECGGAMRPLENSPPYYWAPEVVYANGKFYLYYSVGNETFMELRVAISDEPRGGFVDAGKKLTEQDFAIDAHVFIDEDGTKYLFYATDFLEHTHIGTGTVVDKMIDWTTLEGNPRPVTRARFDWQVYDPVRKEKGGVRWHTVEGPAVIKRKSLYYEMFSGGNWKNQSYGVSFAVSDNIDSVDEWEQFSDGVSVLPILRTTAVVIGPGHNCVVRGPNNLELFCVYHSWTEDARVMAIDRIDFVGDRIIAIAPTHTVQPAPLRPLIRETFAAPPTSGSVEGNWKFGKSGALAGRDSRLHFAEVGSSYVAEITLRCSSMKGRFGFTIGPEVELLIDPASNTVSIESTLRAIAEFDIPAEFAWDTEQLLRIVLDDGQLRVDIERVKLLETRIHELTGGFSLHAREQELFLRSLEITLGFTELFEGDLSVKERGWNFEASGESRLSDGELYLVSPSEYSLMKGVLRASFDAAVNFRVLEDTSPGIFALSIYYSNQNRFRLSVSAVDRRVFATWNGETVAEIGLPPEIVLLEYHQLRVLKMEELTLCYFDDVLIGDFKVDPSAAVPIISCNMLPAAIEMIRVVAI